MLVLCQTCRGDGVVDKPSKLCAHCGGEFVFKRGLDGEHSPERLRYKGVLYCSTACQRAAGEILRKQRMGK